MGRDFYKTLNVPKTATLAEIKKSYRKLALQFHPDRNKAADAEEKFKEINFAYEVLSDKEKRKKYDQFGEAGIDPSAAGPSSGQDYSQFFKNNGNTFSYSTSTGNNGPFDPFSTFQSFFGPNFQFESQGNNDMDDPMGMFSNLAGNRGNTGFPFGNINSSNRSNVQSVNINNNNRINGVTPSIEHEVSLTLEELVAGTTKKFKIGRDKKQQNGGYAREYKLFEVVVKPGWKDNTKIRYQNEANECENKLAGDIVFYIKTKKHQYFNRENENLIYKQSITLGSALSGKPLEFNIPRLDNPPKKVKINKTIISPNTRLTLQNEGLPISKDNGRRGDIIIMFDIEFPTKLTENCKQASRLL